MTGKNLIDRGISWATACPSALALAVVLVLSRASLAADDEHIFRVVEHDDAAALVEAIDRGGDLASRDMYGRTPLHVAAARGFDSSVEILIEAGADMGARTNTDNSPLLSALTARATSTAFLLIDAGADAASRDEDGQTPLHWAVKHGLLDVAQALLDAGAPLNASTHVSAGEGHFGTALTLAAGNGDDAAVRWLTARDASVEPAGAGVSPLHEAARSGHDAIAAYLIDRGAGVEGTDGIDLVDVARGSRLSAVLDRLMGPHNVPRNATPAQLARWLLFAIHADDVDRVGTLLDAGAPVNSSYEASWTALHYALLALRKGERLPDVATLLIERGADATAATAGIGWTPLHLAAILNSPPLIEALLVAGADVNAVTRIGGWTPMRVAEWGREYGFNRRPPRSGSANPEARSILAAAGGAVAPNPEVSGFELYLEGQLMNAPSRSSFWDSHQLHSGLYAAPVQGRAGGSRTVLGAFTTPAAKERLVFEDIGFAHHGESMALVSLVDGTGNARPVMATDRYIEFRHVCLDPATNTHRVVFLVDYAGNWRAGGDLAYMRLSGEAMRIDLHHNTVEIYAELDRISRDGTCGSLAKTGADW